jgi:hypothetical protein
MPVIPVLRRLRQEDQKLKASLSYIARDCLKKKQNQNENNKNTPKYIKTEGKCCFTDT